MVSVEKLHVAFGGFTLFDEVSFVVNRKDRIALVGKNGAGKSTMLKIFAGLQTPSSGSVNIPREVSVGYLPQQMTLADTRSVRQEAELAFEHILQLEHELDTLNRNLQDTTDYESPAWQKLIDRHARVNEEIELLGGNSYQADLERTLSGLGFKRTDFDRPTSEFSGGWRMRIELAKLLLRRPDVLLLDEPTNHLDIESIQWLESFIATRANAVILVSHDRVFIDATTNRTIEIELGKIYDYRVSYSKYVALRQERRQQQLRAYENQQKMLADTEAFIERFRYKATKAVQVQSRIKQLEKVERIEVDQTDTAFLNLRFPPAPRSGSFPLICDGLSKRYGEHVVFQDATFSIARGEKVAFVGRNGEGKSTLVNCIMGQTDFEGSLQLGHNVLIGYFAQNQAQLLDENLSVFDTIDFVATGPIRTKIRNLLGAFMFGGEAADKKVKVLSGGERSRLAMIRLLLQPVNLLILDEPTNHLDMRSKDVLKSALRDFDGTLILVSHDREFLDGLVSKVYEFSDRRIREHLGGIYHFLSHKNSPPVIPAQAGTCQSSLSSPPPVIPPPPSPRANNTRDRGPAKAGTCQSSLSPSPPSPLPPRASNTRDRGRASNPRDRGRAQTKPATASALESQIAQLEQSLAALESQLSTPDAPPPPHLYTDYADLRDRLNAALEQWLSLP